MGLAGKVLTALGDSQFDQLDRSVKTALSKHPSLTPPIQGDASSGNGWVQPGDLLERLELTWTGRGADFVDRESNLAVFDPTAHEDGPTALLARDDLVRRYLSESDMALCWTVLGEKRDHRS